MRPQVTVAFAQSLDGCLAAARGQPLALSGAASLRYTHALRAAHDAILVGLNTVVVDNPSLTVRHVPGEHPQPVILDSQLRCPPQAAVMRHPTHHPWIAATLSAPPDRQASLEAFGARVMRLPAEADGRVSLPALLDNLGALGVRRLMVEGGASVITSFLRQRLADRLSLTIAPRLVGGLPAIAAPLNIGLRQVEWRMLGEDLVLEAEPVYPD